MATEAKVRERPVIFSGPMVKAILDGRKTQTRRVIRPQPTRGKVCSGFDSRGYPTFDEGWHWDPTRNNHHIWLDHEDQNEGPWARWFHAMCPYGVVGDHLWCRETFINGYDTDDDGKPIMTGPDGNDLPEKVWYRATEDGEFRWIDEEGWPTERIPWKPSIHMPRWASRITLEIVGVKVERLTSISEEDAEAEGVAASANYSARDHFQRLWNSINGKRPGCSWEDSPWVWSIAFKRLEDRP